MRIHVSADFTVSVEVAQRAGLYGKRYLTPAGRVVLSEADLRLVRMTPEEYITGLDAEIITREEKKLLISQGGYKMLPDADPVKPEEEDAPAGEVDATAGEEETLAGENDAPAGEEQETEDEPSDIEEEPDHAEQ